MVYHSYFFLKVQNQNSLLVKRQNDNTSLAVTLKTDKNRQEPSRAAKNRQEAFLCIFLLKYYLSDPIHVLFIHISHRDAFAAPKTMKLRYSIFTLFTDKKFCDGVRETRPNRSH